MIKEGPLSQAFECAKEGTIRQKLITWYIKDNSLIEETVERDYFDNGDYVDHVVTVPLVSKGDLA